MLLKLEVRFREWNFYCWHGLEDRLFGRGKWAMISFVYRSNLFHHSSCFLNAGIYLYPCAYSTTIWEIGLTFGICWVSEHIRTRKMLGGRLFPDSIQGSWYRLDHWSGTSSLYIIYVDWCPCPYFSPESPVCSTLSKSFSFYSGLFHTYSYKRYCLLKVAWLVVFQSHLLYSIPLWTANSYPTHYLTVNSSPLFIYTLWFCILGEISINLSMYI